MPTLATIGYEGATIREVLDALEEAAAEPRRCIASSANSSRQTQRKPSYRSWSI